MEKLKITSKTTKAELVAYCEILAEVLVSRDKQISALQTDIEGRKEDLKVMASSAAQYKTMLDDKILQLKESNAKIEQQEIEIDLLKNRTLWERIMNK